MRSLSLAVLLLACLSAIISRESLVQAVPRMRPALMQGGMPFGKRSIGGIKQNARECMLRGEDSQELQELIEAWYKMKMQENLNCLSQLSAFDNTEA